MLLAVQHCQPQPDARQQSVDRRLVGGVGPGPQRIEAHGPVHGAGVHIDVPQVPGKLPGKGGFACPGGAVDRNRYHSFSISFRRAGVCCRPAPSLPFQPSTTAVPLAVTISIPLSAPSTS